ncbi:hypothetical protein CB0940_10340 [Cercospora beticola]|uniref:Uncharacterized protein n=1 Tax=Cercospora beticola TaxID=122368 RepID=A0A2G5HUI9_CERBT|nr:hypothetical protein CB0940_10340 [Cercospora beticola]PIA96185.1 hypothetical protein CB0940_10340 [Cercospora beticola]WPB07054.1 hypothetical protein RHO25_011714 [Cercospora beticola]CAK1366999.1 unnamed protein product [Cercospora beticola]
MVSDARNNVTVTIFLALVLTSIWYTAGCWPYQAVAGPLSEDLVVSGDVSRSSSEGNRHEVALNQTSLIVLREDDNSNIVERGSRGSRRLAARFPAFEMPVDEASYPSASDFEKLKDVEKRVVIYEDEDDFSNYRVKLSPGRPHIKNKYVTEHILELQTIPLFLEALERGTTKEGGSMGDVQISASDLLKYWNTVSLPASVESIGSGDVNKRIPNDRIFQQLGSWAARSALLLADEEINAYKARIWQGVDPQAKTKFKAYVRAWIYDGEDPDPFLRAMRATRAVFSYMQQPDVKKKWEAIVNDVERELELIAEHIPAFKKILWGWDNFLPKFLADRSKKARHWILWGVDHVFAEIEEAQNDRRATMKDQNDVAEVLHALEESTDKGMELEFE